MTIVVESDASDARRIEANLYKLVNVVRVHDITHVPSIFRELAMVKVATTIETRTQIMQLVDVFRARVVDVAPDSLVIETTGTEEKIEGLLEVLQPYGILELVRTGRVGMLRGKQGVAVEPSDRLEDEDPSGDDTDTEDPNVSYSV